MSQSNLTVTSPAQNTSAQNGLTILGTCASGTSIALSGSGLLSPSSTPCANGAFSQVILFTSGDGPKVITLSQTDGSGNLSSITVNFIKDTIAPKLTLTGPAANFTAANSVTIVGTCENGITINLTGQGLASPSSTVCSGGNFSQTILFTGGSGTKTISISQTDAAGNSSTQSRDFISDVSTAYTWKSLRIGSGGYLVGMDIAKDGTKVVRTDTYGAYWWNGTQWVQLVTATSMPAGDVGTFLSGGVYEIRIAPSNTNRFYMNYLGNIYRTENRGTTWVKTAFNNVAVNANDGYRTSGPKMAIDPINADIVYAGTPKNGLWVTTNAGSSWSLVSSIPISQAVNGVYPGITGLVFDPNAGQSGGKTNLIYASSYGNGVYQSTDAGTTWKNIAGGPLSVTIGKVATDGIYYATGDTTGRKIWRLSSGIWTDITPDSNTWNTIVTDPFNPAHLVAARSGGWLNISLDRGSTWGGEITGSISGGHPIIRNAADIPWLAWTNESFMSVGDMIADPTVPNKIWFSEGIGVWYATVPNDNPTTYGTIWNSQSYGIEQLVATDIASPPGGALLVTSWDRPVFRITTPGTPPTTHGPDNINEIVAGWSVDYATTNPNFVVALMNWRGIEKTSYSTNGGQTWSPFPSYPPVMGTGNLGGTIAASTPTNILWVPEVNSNPYYTQDGGTTWKQISISGIPTTGETGWGAQYSYARHIAVADRVTSGTFYMYNYLTGLYRSDDGGDSWTLVKTGEIAPFSKWNAKLKAVPGKAGHLFFTSGNMDSVGAVHPAPTLFMHSTDGGTTWAAIPNVNEVRSFGFGKELATNGYPAIYIVGWVNNIYGIYRSNDEGQTWAKIGDYPIGSLDIISTIHGDANKYGMVYVGFVGSGFAYLGP